MVMCSNCHKRVAVIFVTKLENGEKTSQGLCIKCAKELGLPIENMMGDIYNKMGISPEQLEDMADEIGEMLPQTDSEDGGAPAIDLPKLFKDSGLADAIKAASENLAAFDLHIDAQRSKRGRSGSLSSKRQCLLKNLVQTPMIQPLTSAQNTVPSLTPSKCQRPTKAKERRMSLFVNS